MTTSARSPHETGTDKLLLTVDEGIARVTFNNPEKHNALSTDMRAALPGLLQFLQANEGVRVVVLTGAGSKAFVFVPTSLSSERDGRRQIREPNTTAPWRRPDGHGSHWRNQSSL